MHTYTTHSCIPTFPRTQMTDVVPFANLWRKISLYFFADLTLTANKMYEWLRAVVEGGRKRWSWLMGMNNIARQILSWTGEGSRALDAYVQLLTDR